MELIWSEKPKLQSRLTALAKRDCKEKIDAANNDRSWERSPLSVSYISSMHEKNLGEGIDNK